MGSGVIGRTAPVAFVTEIALAIATVAVPDPLTKAILALSMPALAVFYLVAAFWFANKYPSLSVLEGSQATAYRKVEGAAKGQDIEALPMEMRRPTTPPKTITGGVRDGE